MDAPLLLLVVVVVSIFLFFGNSNVPSFTFDVVDKTSNIASMSLNFVSTLYKKILKSSTAPTLATITVRHDQITDPVG